MKNHNDILMELSACREAKEFSKNYPDAEAAWDNCPRGDWMLWIAKKLKVDNRKLTLAKGLCAQTVIHLMKDERSKKAVQAAIDFGNGLIDDQELKDVAADADAYADTYDAAAYAAYAAADDAYADTYDAAAYDAARKRNQQITADICREILTEEVLTIYKSL